MTTRRLLRTPAAAALTALLGAAGLALAPPATADDGHHAHHAHQRHAEPPHHVQVRLQDDCDPISFNQALGPGACTGDGDTTFDELVASLVATHDAPKWRIHPRRLEVHQGDRLVVRNTGGEFHTFTEVAAFGPGCVPPLNDLLGLSGPPAADCAAAFADTRTALPAGGRGEVDTRSMTPGTHRFECMVHPWMKAEVEVEAH